MPLISDQSNLRVSRNTLPRKQDLSKRLVNHENARLGLLARDTGRRARSFARAALEALDASPLVGPDGVIIDNKKVACELSREARGCIETWARLVRLPTPAKEGELPRQLIDVGPEISDAEILATLRGKPADAKQEPANGQPVPTDPGQPAVDVPSSGS